MKKTPMLTVFLLLIVAIPLMILGFYGVPDPR